MNSNVIGSDKFKDTKERNKSQEILTQKRTFGKFRNNSQDFSSSKEFGLNKKDYRSTDIDIEANKKVDFNTTDISEYAKQRKANDMKSATIFTVNSRASFAETLKDSRHSFTPSMKNPNNSKTKDLKLNKPLKKEIIANAESTVNQNIESSALNQTGKYEINFPSTIQPSEIKKIFDEKGVHIYNIRESNNWKNTPFGDKITFEIREEKGNSNIVLKDVESKLSEFGLKINPAAIPTVNTNVKDELMYPVQAKWNDTNLKFYHAKQNDDKSNKSSQKSFNLKKSDIQMNKTLISYKNDKKHAPAPRRKIESVSSSSKGQL